MIEISKIKMKKHLWLFHKPKKKKIKFTHTHDSNTMMDNDQMRMFLMATNYIVIIYRSTQTNKQRRQRQ